MANSQLDRYLEVFEARLKSLPSDRRQEEMREIRQHLEALAAGHRLAGLSEDEAVEAAIRQFGHAEQVGQDLSKASRRQLMRPIWNLLVYILTVVVNVAIFAVNDYPETWLARLALALILSAGILGLGVMEVVQTYLRSRNKQTQA